MRGKASSATRVRLSPNEEAQLAREELDRRRKLRLQQVREQERFIAGQVRRQVRERKQHQLQVLADSLQHEWQQQHTHRLQTLHTNYELSLSTIGQGHRSAQENEPDVEALCQERVQRQERAEQRHREALRELSTRRHEEEQQQRWHIEARRKALEEEKKRAERVSSLPPPPPNPVESIVIKTQRPLKPAEGFSVSHFHMTQTAVDQETDTEPQLSAQQAAELEFIRLEELQQEEARDRQERQEKARLRGKHALRREQRTQDRARLLCELEHLQQADLLRRRQVVSRVPAQIFQPLYRQEELRDEQQRDLEIAFQDVYTDERKIKGDLMLQLVPEPLPPPSAASHDEELDVTLEPACTLEGEETDTTFTDSPGKEPVREPASSTAPADHGRRALTRMLERIRSQRESCQPSVVLPYEGHTDEEVESVESATLSSYEMTEEQTPSRTHTEDALEVCDDAVVSGTLLPSEERVQRMSAHPSTYVEELLSQQEEQLALLEELEEKRRKLEQRLRETQQSKSTPLDRDQKHGTQEFTSPPEPPPKVELDDPHTHRLHQYQQRLLQQNRLHKKCVEEARRRLEEYQRTLNLRNAIGSKAAAQVTLQQPGVNLERASVGTGPDQGWALPFILNPGPLKAPASDCPSQLGQIQVTVQSQSPSRTPVIPTGPVGSESAQPSVLSGASLQEVDGREATPGLPLPPPAVVLELLRSRQHYALIQSADDIGSVTQPSSDPDQTSTQPTPLLEGETERQEMMRLHMRRQRDALKALIAADAQGPMSNSSGVESDQETLNALLNVIEEANGCTKPSSASIQQDKATHTTLTLSNGVCDPAPVNRGRVKPPVSRPPVRLAFFRQMEQHELSAIQEVDTPVNVSLDTEPQFESSSASLPAVSSEDSHSPSERSQVTGRIGRMSWRETLLQDASTSSLSSVMQQQEEKRLELASAGVPSSDPDYLSSTTISTGSFSTSDHEPSFAAADASYLSSSLISSPCHMTNAQSSEMRDPVQQIIDKYSLELNDSLRHAGSMHSGPSWSSVLQEERSFQSSAEISGVFQPLQPHPDIDSSSSSANAVRGDQSSRSQGWNEAVNRILERLSGQLSIRHSTATPSASDRDSHTSHHPDSWAALQDNSSSSDLRDCSVLSQVITRAPDMESSQVLDDSTDGLKEAVESTAAVVSSRFSPDRTSEVGSALRMRTHALQHSEPDRSTFTDHTHDDNTGVFLPLPCELTHNETVDCSTAPCVPLETEVSICVADESADLSHHSLQPLRSDTPVQSQADLQISVDQLSVTHDSLCEAGTVVEEEMEMLKHQSPVLENTLTELLERAQAVGAVKGILEESIISFISLPESDITNTEDTGGEPQDVTSERSQGEAQSQTMEDLRQPVQMEPPFPHAVMLLESQCSPAQCQRRNQLAQRSAIRAANIKHKHTKNGKNACVPQNKLRATGNALLKSNRDHMTQSVQLRPEHAAEKLKNVCEVRICTAEDGRLQEVEMLRRTHRLYNQLEEVKQKKALQIRQESYTKNREKARDFQRKTLEKLRAKQKH